MDERATNIDARAIPPEELVERIRAGDGMAETLFYRRYYKGLLIMLEQRTRDRARAEDLVHDTMVTVLKRLRTDGIEQPERLDPFVQQTAKYIYIGWVHKAEQQNENRGTMDDNPIEVPTIEDLLDREQTRALVRELISQLKVARDRELMHRFYVLDQSKAVICEALGLSAVHFDRVINRARNRFRELVAGELNHGK